MREDRLRLCWRDIPIPRGRHRPACELAERVCLDQLTLNRLGREQIRARLGEGWTEQEIYDYFAEQYGERVLAAPRARGINWLVYLVPPLFIIIGVYVLYSVLTGSKEAVEEMVVSDQPEMEPADDDYIARVEEELKRQQ